MQDLKAGTYVKVTTGGKRKKVSKAVVIKTYQEERFGVMWDRVQVVVSKNNEPAIIVVSPKAIELID